MAKKENQKPENTAAPAAAKCLEESCKKPGARAGFCAEHFVWFKEGIITKGGQHPRDFDKKLYDFQRRQTKVA